MTKTIIITGSSRGIGAATAKLAGKRGWSVALNDVGNEKAATRWSPRSRRPAARRSR